VAQPTTRVANLAEARRACVLVCAVVNGLLEGPQHIELDDV